VLRWPVFGRARRRRSSPTDATDLEIRFALDTLDPFQQRWLRACAVFPALRWPLTLYIGRALADADRAGTTADHAPADPDREPPSLDIEAAAGLARLGWFRTAFIPLAVRRRLIAGLSVEDRATVRSALERLFATEAALRSDTPDAVPIARERPLASLLPTPRSDGAAADVLMARFMLDAPTGIEQRFPPGVARLLGLRFGLSVWVRLALAAVTALALAAGIRGLASALVAQWTVAGDTVAVTAPSMIAIPGGHFTMGSPPDEPGRWDDEGPQRQVSVPPFAIAETEVTFAQWDACVDDGGCGGYWLDDEGWGRGDRPVVNVSWEDAQRYVAWLNTKLEGEPYRLPSEAEWEYAARAGTLTRFAFGDEISSSEANFDGNIGKTTEVGSYPANAWGLFDMHGNVWEWVEDCWHDNYEAAPTDGSAWLEADGGDCSSRVRRGGSWGNTPWFLRSAYRVWNDPDSGTTSSGSGSPGRLPLESFHLYLWGSGGAAPSRPIFIHNRSP
jgi:formylglycine-generating enzyme required for sulfatase activity